MPDTFDSHDGHTHSEQPHHEAHKKIEHHFTPASVVPGVKLEQLPPKPSIGRIVHFVLDGGSNKGQHRPAIIIKVWDENPTIDSLVQLQVYTDGSNDGEIYKRGIYWATSVHYADPSENKPGTYHWPEKV